MLEALGGRGVDAHRYSCTVSLNTALDGNE